MGQEIDFSIQVEDIHFAYLKLQKGSLDSLKDQRAEWENAYQLSLAEQYRSIRPWLSLTCNSLLDVGSGLGGIDILIARHYVDSVHMHPHIYLMDGVDDPPVMNLHRETFNNMEVARNFMHLNGVPVWNWLHYFRTDTKVFFKSFDLIVSFGSWCFHFEPNAYLPQLLNGAIDHDTVLILDVRAGRPKWDQQLSDVLSLEGTIVQSKKWDRRIYRLKK